MTPHTLIRISGSFWLCIGLFLIGLGGKFLSAPPSPHGFSFIHHFSSAASETVILWIMLCALTLGFFKGRLVLKRSVDRQIARLEALPTPLSLRHLYTKGYLFLVLGMIGLGISLRFLPIALDVRGGIDIAIGTALIQGALRFFRHPLSHKIPS